jgi:hypothetical protein
MSLSTSLKSGAAVLAVGAATTMSTPALAQSNWDSGKWEFNAILYAYLPSLGGSLNVPFNSSSPSNINVDFDTLLDNLNFAFMGTFDMHNGRWGLFTDVMYLNVSGDKSSTRDFTVGGGNLPANVTGDLSLDLKGTLWTLAGEYRLIGDKKMTLDVLGGARLFTLKPEIGYSLSGDISTLPIPGRSGTTSARVSNWDAIIGVKGLYRFGDQNQWSIPYYADIGTGQSDLTWQVAAGVAYSYKWGDLLAMWRYIDYKFDSDSPVNDITFNGPMFGVRFHW